MVPQSWAGLTFWCDAALLLAMASLGITGAALATNCHTNIHPALVMRGTSTGLMGSTRHIIVRCGPWFPSAAQSIPVHISFPPAACCPADITKNSSCTAFWQQAKGLNSLPRFKALLRAGLTDP